MTDEPEFRTHSVITWSTHAVYDKINLDIGRDRFFLSPEMARAIAESLKREANKMRPEPPE